jgi:hypothetical protein
MKNKPKKNVWFYNMGSVFTVVLQTIQKYLNEWTISSRSEN